MALGTAAVIDYRLLGPIEVGVNGHALDIGGQKQRALLAILLLSANEPVSRDVLVDRLWGEHPPAGAQHTLEVYISRLRKTLKPAAGGPGGADPAGRLPAAGRRASASTCAVSSASPGRAVRALAADAPGQAAAVLGEALALWRGAPLADVSDEPFAQAEIARLEELRAGVIEDRIEADLALGRHADVVSELEALVAAHPLRERLYQQLMIALYRCGRQAEALAVYQIGTPGAGGGTRHRTGPGPAASSSAPSWSRTSRLSLLRGTGAAGDCRRRATSGPVGRPPPTVPGC